MKVLVFEDNLMWSTRLKQTLKALNHEVEILQTIPSAMPEANAAIVNLGSPKMPARDLVAKLKDAGIYVIAHAGHKEKELRALGQELACDRLASNSELTFKLESLLPTKP